jgi:phage terminase large subunit-like protein
VRWRGMTIDIPAAWSSLRRRWESPDGQYYFDPEAAEFAEGFFPTFLEHHIGAFDGLPFTLLPYQQLLVMRPLFGWKRAADGLRRFRKVFLAVPKGSGKSPFGAGLGIFGAFFDGEAGAEVYAVAADRKQAGIVFDSAKVMVQRNEHLNERCEVFRDSIKLKGSTESFQVLSSDASTKHGFRPHFIVFDEFHAQPNRDLYDALYRGMGKRRQPVLVMITTAGDDDESICFEEWDYARRVISGTVPDDGYLPVVFEAQPGDKWQDEQVWRRVNPGYGITMQADYFKTEAAAAAVEPRKLNSFLQLHLNRWVNQATAWLPIDWWDACDEPMPADDVLATWPCAAGLDLAQKIDLAALVLVFRQRLTEAEQPIVVTPDGEPAEMPTPKTINLNYRIVVRPYFWIPQDTMQEREQQDGIPYSQWEKQGLVTMTEGATIDYSLIYRDITERIVPKFPRLKQGVIGYDPAFATDIASSLRDRAGLQVAEVLQNYQHLSEACYVFEALVKAKRVTHGGHRVLRNHVENVAVKRDDARRIKPVKPKNTKRIDGVVAALMGLKALATIPDSPIGPQLFFVGGR